jgi:acetoin utilization deacetylase AcuC-like enzyme/formylglycine-generating enzyme required for sulfatase activity
MRRLFRECALLGLLALGAACQKVDRTAPATVPAQSPTVVVTDSGIEMVLIPAGRFVMGRDGAAPEQGPAHDVQIDAFLMDRYEVTQAVYAQVDPINGSHFKGPALPTEMISWGKAALYCNLRSAAEGFQPCYNDSGECDFEANGYRLPTEAEWEYACRAGTDTPFSFGADPRDLDQHAWYAGNASKKTHAVGRRKPNAWGLFDMHGNVAEWCNDFYDPDYYRTSPTKNPRGPAEGARNVLRGGHWGASPESCSSAFRFGEEPGFSDACFARDAIGFRCVRKARVAAPDRPDSGQPLPKDEAPENASSRGTDRRPRVDRFAVAGNEPAGRDCLALTATGFVYGDIYLRHQTGPGHPEQPERLVAIVERLRREGLLEKLTCIQPRPADECWLTGVHSPEYVAQLKQFYAQGDRFAGSRDTPISESSYTAAVAAVGGVLAAVDAVLSGEVRNAFCAVRPPGHHATRDRAMGFCLLNNVAIAARYIQQKHKLPKVLIVDWDAHHGNGTQEIFYNDPDVFYFSVHQYPFYPGTGSADERGAGPGEGLTLNVPLPSSSGDREFQRALSEQLLPAARRFQPDFVLISAGFDAHQNDLLGGMRVTTEGFSELTRIVKRMAEEHCQGRLVSVLEGGYHLDSLAASVEAHLRNLME